MGAYRHLSVVFIIWVVQVLLYLILTVVYIKTGNDRYFKAATLVLGVTCLTALVMILYLLIGLGV